MATQVLNIPSYFHFSTFLNPPETEKWIKCRFWKQKDVGLLDLYSRSGLLHGSGPVDCSQIAAGPDWYFSTLHMAHQRGLLLCGLFQVFKRVHGPGPFRIKVVALKLNKPGWTAAEKIKHTALKWSGFRPKLCGSLLFVLIKNKTR